MNWNLSLTSPSWFIAVCILTGVVYAFLLYRRSKANRVFEEYPVLRTLLAVIRATLVAFIAFLLLGPFINNTSFNSEKPLVVIGVDESRSTASDSAQVSDALNGLRSKLSDKFDLEVLSVGERTKLKKGDSLRFQAKSTDLASYLNHVSTEFPDKNLAAGVLITDGIYNKGANPFFTSRQLAHKVFTLGLGDTTPRKDASIDQVLYNSVTYLGNEYPVQIDVKAQKLKGKTAILSVTKNGRRVFQQELRYTKDVDVIELPVNIRAEKVGVEQITVDLSVLEEEENKSNNRYSFFVDVIESRKQVELWAGSMHPDIGAFKFLISGNDNYQFSIKRKRDDRSAKKQDMVILYDWFANQTELNQYEQLKSNGIPVLIVMGERFESSIFNKASQDVKYNDLGRGVNQALPLVNTNFEYFELEQDLRETIEEWPPLTTPFGRLKSYKAGDVVLFQKIGRVETSDPLLILRNENNYRYGVLAGVGLWQWRLRDFESNGEHRLSADLVNSWLQFLSVRDKKKLLTVSPSQKINASNEAVILNGELYNQSLDAVEGAEIEVIITDEEGKQITRLMGPRATKYQLKLYNLNTANYTFEARTQLGGQLLTDKGYFSVVANEQELMNLTADHSLLRQLSSQTGGDFSMAQDWSLIADKLLNDKDLSSVIKEDKEWTELIDLRILFWLLLALLTIEWFIRKFIGGY